ncbi:MAG: DNA-processing protein DprA [Aureispira sp.]
MNTATTPAVEEELIAKIALQIVPRIGNKMAQELLAHYGSAKTLFEQATIQELCQFAYLGPTTAQLILDKSTRKRAEEEWAFTQQYKIQVLSQTEQAYPKRLQQCADAPSLLYYKGNAPLNASKVVAIVGTRKPSARGREFCERLLDDLQGYDPLIVSGLAYGIDITAHRKSIDLQLPNIGVVAHGLDRIYPSQHQSTAQRMVQCGGILTEFRTQTEPLAKHFPMRNRIIAGMADAVVVVETANRGGSMITAYLANEYNKEVFAVPGRLNDPLAKGCNHLIKTHRACLIESAADMAYLLGWQESTRPLQQKLFPTLSKAEQALVNHLVGQTLHLEEINRQMQLSSSQLAALLLELEFKGVLRALPGKRFELV